MEVWRVPEIMGQWGSSMDMTLAIFAQCRNCSNLIQIRTLFAIPQEKENDPGLLPKDIFPLRIVCPECRHWFAYSESDLVLGQPQKLSRTKELDPVCVIFENSCGWEGCTSLTKWYVSTKPGLLPDELKQSLFSGIPEIECENRHSLLKALREGRYRTRVPYD
jgi:hypothetical protein